MFVWKHKAILFELWKLWGLSSTPCSVRNRYLCGNIKQLSWHFPNAFDILSLRRLKDSSTCVLNASLTFSLGYNSDMSALFPGLPGFFGMSSEAQTLLRLPKPRKKPESFEAIKPITAPRIQHWAVRDWQSLIQPSSDMADDNGLDFQLSARRASKWDFFCSLLRQSKIQTRSLWKNYGNNTHNKILLQSW